MFTLFPSAFVLSLFTVTGLGGQQPIESVLKYTLKEFNEHVTTKNHFVLFFVPWNSESKSVSPIWEELGQKYNNLGGNDLILAKVDCTTDVELCAEQNVTDYPTLKFYKFGSQNTNGVKFRGIRDFHSIEHFINSFINPGDYVYGARVSNPPAPSFGLHVLIDENFDNAIENGHAFINFCAPWSSRCIDLQNVWPELAQHFQYDDDVTFGQLDCTMYKAKCNEHNVRGYPSLVWFSDGVLDEKYPKKELDYDSLKVYVYKKLGKIELQKKNPTIDDENQHRSAALVMDTDNFHEVLEAEPLIFINFHTPWCTPCQKLEPIWEELGAHYKYNKNVKIAKVDCTRNKILCEENNIQEFPTLNVYEDGDLKGPYAGPMTTDELILFTDAVINNPKEEL